MKLHPPFDAELWMSTRRVEAYGPEVTPQPHDFYFMEYP